MLSDEEKKAIDNMKSLLLYSKEHEYFSPFQEQEIDDMNIVLNIVEKQSKEIEHQKEKRENQKQELAILNEKQKEFNKLVNTVNSYKGQFKKQQKEIEELRKYKKYYEEMEEVNKKFISADKIKAKIEPRLKELDEQMKKEWREYGNSREYQDMEDEWNFLQSLLEEKE